MTPYSAWTDALITFKEKPKLIACCLCVLAFIDFSLDCAEARHKPQPSDDPNAMAAAPPATGGGDKFHAVPVPTDWGFPELNVRVANFAVQNLGGKVGNGECWTLAAKALEAAGANPASGYTFGRLLPQNETWYPGDIIQFTNCQFVDVQPHRRSTITVGTPNHTAIVYAVKDGLVTVLQQNVSGDKHVQTGVLNFSEMVSGTVQVYRPVPFDGRSNPNKGGLKIRYSLF